MDCPLATVVIASLPMERVHPVEFYKVLAVVDAVFDTRTSMCNDGQQTNQLMQSRLYIHTTLPTSENLL